MFCCIILQLLNPVVQVIDHIVSLVSWKPVSSPSLSERSLDSIGRSRQESLSSVEEDDYDTLDDIDSDKNIIRTKVHLVFFTLCFAHSLGILWIQKIHNLACNDAQMFPFYYRNFFVCLTWPAKTRESLARSTKYISGEEKYYVYLMCSVSKTFTYYKNTV